MEEDKRDLISREISKFRDTHKVTVISLYLFVCLDLALGCLNIDCPVVCCLDKRNHNLNHNSAVSASVQKKV